MAASSSIDRKPSQSEIDSEIPPASAPSRFDPIASAPKLAAAKRLMKTIPAKKTGSDTTAVEIKALSQNERKNSASVGMTNETTHVTRIAQYARDTGMAGKRAATMFASTIRKSSMEMTIELTTQVVPKRSAIRLTICASSNRNPAPRK